MAANQNKKYNLPKKFTILGNEFDVIIGKSVTDEANVGETHFAHGEIRVRTESNGKKFTYDFVRHTFYHELCHVLMISMSQMELNQNEEFIDLLGGMMLSFEKSAKY